MKRISGYSLIEMLVVLAVFGILAIISTQVVLLSIRSSRRSEGTVRVKENLDYAVSVMERQLRFAKSVSCTSSTQIAYVDSIGNSSSFSCAGPVGSQYVASGSARLTSDEISVTCIFTCPAATGNITPSVSISLTGSDIETSGVEKTTTSSQTTIFLRQ